jgi:hypothetical protein
MSETATDPELCGWCKRPETDHRWDRITDEDCRSNPHPGLAIESTLEDGTPVFFWVEALK